MTYIDQDWLKKELADVELARKQGANLDMQQSAIALELQKDSGSLMKEQLSLANELETIENLLRGKILVPNKEMGGTVQWTDPKNKDLVILTEYGVHLIMNTIQFYLNKNTLLSNYDEDTILHKMEDFSMDLVDTIFMESEKVFRKPTFEECTQKLDERLERKTALRGYAYKLLGKEVKKEEIRDSFIKEIEGTIEKEIEKISEQEMKDKYKRFAILIREIQDAVHSTYLRAWNGQERRTLRQHINISETVGYNPPQPKGSRSSSIFGGWFGKR